jgi:hypothetical protein
MADGKTANIINKFKFHVVPGCIMMAPKKASSVPVRTGNLPQATCNLRLKGHPRQQMIMISQPMEKL